MRSRIESFFVVLLALMIALTAEIAFAQEDSRSGVSGFFTGLLGGFNLELPGGGPAGDAVGEVVTFEDVYGSKSGLTIGAEGGLGSSRIGLFGIVRYKTWNKSGDPELFGIGSFSGDLTWKQKSVSIGPRYYFLQTKRPDKLTILPYLGIGIISSEVTERLDGVFISGLSSTAVDIEANLSGTGFYVEVGGQLDLRDKVAIGAVLEYSKLNLGATVSGTRFEIDGGGGIYLGIALTALFGGWAI